MLYIILTFLSGIFSGFVSILFRHIELKTQSILMPKQLITQMVLFIIFLLIFREFFTDVFIDLGFIQLGWLVIYVLFSSLSYYAVQVFYEFFSGNTLFASEDEVRKYIEKLEDEKH